MRSNDNTFLLELFEHVLVQLADFFSGIMENAPATIEALLWMTLIVNATQMVVLALLAWFLLMWAQRSGKVPGRLYSPARTALGYMGGSETDWGIMVYLPFTRYGPSNSRRRLSACLDEHGQLWWFSWFIGPDCAQEIHWPHPEPALREFLTH